MKRKKKRSAKKIKLLDEVANRFAQIAVAHIDEKYSKKKLMKEI